MTEPRTLLDLQPGEEALIASVAGGGARIDKLAAMGILPGVALRVQQARPVVVIECGETVLAIERELAGEIRVCSLDDVAGLGVE